MTKSGMTLDRLPQDQRDSLLTTLWEKSLVGIALVAEDGTFEYANPAFCKLTEYTEPELRKKKFENITYPDDLQADVMLAAEVSKGLRPDYIMMKRYITKTGKLVWVILNVHPMEIQGEFHYFVSQISEVLPIVGVQVSPPVPVKRNLWKWAKDNWAQVTLILSAFAVLIAEIIKRLPS